jgi:hypothetical protein
MKIDINDDLMEKLTSHVEAKDRDIQELMPEAIELYLGYLDEQHENRMIDIELDSLVVDEANTRKRSPDMADSGQENSLLYNSLVRCGLWDGIQRAV